MGLRGGIADVVAMQSLCTGGVLLYYLKFLHSEVFSFLVSFGYLFDSLGVPRVCLYQVDCRMYCPIENRPSCRRCLAAFCVGQEGSPLIWNNIISTTKGPTYAFVATSLPTLTIFRVNTIL